MQIQFTLQRHRIILSRHGQQVNYTDNFDYNIGASLHVLC